MDVLSIKQRFGIIGNSPLLDRAIDIARQVSPTDLSVLITGESGTGKEFFPKIIHYLSSRKHGQYIAVNCGAIPEGTIDSELFGHEKGSFTGAHEARKGYFEVAHGGTIFLDEVAELPLSTQVRLLRILETGEFIRVGSSKVIKTDVRVVAATNVKLLEAIQMGRFREDLYYRLNSVPIYVPALRERKEDSILLFKKFANDFAEKYRMPSLQLDEEAQYDFMHYKWVGNIRQLKNITEQMSIIESQRIITRDILRKYLSAEYDRVELPVLFKSGNASSEISERDLLYKVLFDMRKDINDLKKLVNDIIENKEIHADEHEEKIQVIEKLYNGMDAVITKTEGIKNKHIFHDTLNSEENTVEADAIIDESLSIGAKEKEMIIKALEKYKGKRKPAADELGISERTLYRKIKEYEIEM